METKQMVVMNPWLLPERERRQTCIYGNQTASQAVTEGLGILDISFEDTNIICDEYKNLNCLDNADNVDILNNDFGGDEKLTFQFSSMLSMNEK